MVYPVEKVRLGTTPFRGVPCVPVTSIKSKKVNQLVLMLLYVIMRKWKSIKVIMVFLSVPDF